MNRAWACERGVEAMNPEVRHRIVADRYRDSVSLLALAARLREVVGIDGASAVMATPANLETVVAGGFTVPDGVRPNDLLISVRGTGAACVEAMDRLDSLLAGPTGRSASVSEAGLPRTLRQAMLTNPESGLALISVPGPYAAAEAAKALDLGLHVMLFSDNVSVEDEVALKAAAADRGLLMMGPDCGTAVINGVPLGFANVVARGPIAVIGASGTGMQEIIARIHRLGSGVSQAIGTGGRDLSDAVGARTTIQALTMISEDPSTEIVIVVSKPPSAAVLDRVFSHIAALRAHGRLRIPVVGAFLGIDATRLAGSEVIGAISLAHASDIAVALVEGRSPAAARQEPLPPLAARPRRAGSRRWLRAAFCGGTFSYEAQFALAERGIRVAANAPIEGNTTIASPEPVGIAQWPDSHAVLDLGSDEFTVGRPHPMLDPTVRDDFLIAAWRDPSTAVILFDVVLGHGSAAAPVVALLDRLIAQRRDCPSGDEPIAIAHVCGTELDPQNRDAIIAALGGAGVTVAGSNFEAAAWAGQVLRQLELTSRSKP